MKVSKQRPSLDQPTVLSRYSIDIKMDVSPTSDYYNLSKLSLEPNRFEPNNKSSDTTSITSRNKNEYGLRKSSMDGTEAYMKRQNRLNSDMQLMMLENRLRRLQFEEDRAQK